LKGDGESRTPQLLIVGVVGGVASGKSLVSAELVRLGACLLDGDRAGHEVLKQTEVKQAIIERWGEGCLRADGEVNRAAVAAIVFAPGPQGAAELEFLERLTHPRIRKLLEEQIDRYWSERQSVAVLDAAVMFKSGWDRLCQRIVFVDAPRRIRLARTRQRGWTEEQFQQREAAQEPAEWKRARTTDVIDNSGSPAETRRRVERFWQSLPIPKQRRTHVIPPG